MPNRIKDKGIGKDPNKTNDEPTELEEGKTYVVAIGIDDYPAESGFGKLGNVCTNDANKFVETLTTQFKNVEEHKILLNAEATKAGIINLFATIVSDQEINTDQNNLIIYFSGHGTIIKSKNDQNKSLAGGWIPFDGKGDKATIFTWDELSEAVFDFCFLHFLLISDCCNSGSFFSSKESVNTNSSTSGNLKNQHSSHYLCASSSNDTAKITEGAMNSVFTDALLQTLNNSNANLDWDSVSVGINSLLRYEGTTKYAKLNIFETSNTGSFVIQRKPELFQPKVAAGHLKNGLSKFNYTAQVGGLRIAKNQRKKLFCFYGTVDCGLGFLKYKLNNSVSFPKPCICIPVTITNPMEEIKIELVEKVKNGLNQHSLTTANLIPHFLGVLQSHSVKIELDFTEDFEEYPTINKKLIVQELIKLLDEIKLDNISEHQVILIITDRISPENLDNYQPIFDPIDFPSFAPTYFKKVEMVEKDYMEIWFDEFHCSIDDDTPELIELKASFRKNIHDEIESIIISNSGRPGRIMRHIINTYNCNEFVPAAYFA